MLDLYQAGTSPVHMLKPGWKILCLAAVGSALFAVDHIGFSTAMLAATLVLYRIAGLPLSRAWGQIRPAVWVFGLIFAAQVIFNSWIIGLYVLIRLAVLLMLAGLLTLTTRSSDMIDGINAGLGPLRRIGVNPERVSLAISLTLRFIPVLSHVVHDVREAQRARGLDRNILSLAIPAIIRTIRMADEVSDAIDARGS
ncbi:energy-coupling factor transporter transmembrane protein EcfT [Phaeobacter sp. B1627]|uniref:energy-coupling factor transporter transmembrane component T family protein n=1 Tax=Phaeobacter sp. B1627 TaxID=2583809 RepID=UPI00111A31DE|nr:energy-coupling factor transporter transmembrane protein EcfT [Phaeobacter sp. B1627]TNJ45934.1 energy-coupling factor transporter transmembrane protein EcfT [Phaeobacter sp. B1627]